MGLANDELNEYSHLEFDSNIEIIGNVAVFGSLGEHIRANRSDPEIIGIFKSAYCKSSESNCTDNSNRRIIRYDLSNLKFLVQHPVHVYTKSSISEGSLAKPFIARLADLSGWDELEASPVGYKKEKLKLKLGGNLLPKGSGMDFMVCEASTSETFMDRLPTFWIAHSTHLMTAGYDEHANNKIKFRDPERTRLQDWVDAWEKKSVSRLRRFCPDMQGSYQGGCFLGRSLSRQLLAESQ